MSKEMDEKALEAAVKRYRDKYREFWPGSAPTDNDSRELLLAAFPFSKTTQAGESEIIECLLAGEEFVFDPATHFCHANDGCAQENGLKYVPAPSLAAAQAENERLRQVAQLLLGLVKLHNGNQHDDINEIIKQAETALAGKEPS